MPDIEEGAPVAEPATETKVGNDNDDDEELLEWWQERTLVTRVWQGVAIATAVVNLVSLILHGGSSAAVLVAALLAIALAVGVFYAQLLLQDIDTLRTVQNELRDQVNRMNTENSELEENAMRLETQVGALEQTEAELEGIAQEQGANAQSLVDLVKENGEAVDGLKKCVKARTEQTFLRAVLDSDFDQNNEFSDQDLQMLQFRMKGVPGVTVNFDLLQQKIAKTNRSLSAVTALLHELDDDDDTNTNDDERIFTVESDGQEMVQLLAQ